MEITFYNGTGHPQIYLSTDDDHSFYTSNAQYVADANPAFSTVSSNIDLIGFIEQDKV